MRPELSLPKVNVLLNLKYNLYLRPAVMLNEVKQLTKYLQFLSKIPPCSRNDKIGSGCNQAKFYTLLNR